jgi:hypothetical protein
LYIWTVSRTYNNQHWVIQEAEQRRLADSRVSGAKPSSASPAASSPASSMHSQASPSPVYENVHNSNSKHSARPGFGHQVRLTGAGLPQEPMLR